MNDIWECEKQKTLKGHNHPNDEATGNTCIKCECCNKMSYKGLPQ